MGELLVHHHRDVTADGCHLRIGECRNHEQTRDGESGEPFILVPMRR